MRASSTAQWQRRVRPVRESAQPSRRRISRPAATAAAGMPKRTGNRVMTRAGMVAALAALGACTSSSGPPGLWRPAGRGLELRRLRRKLAWWIERGLQRGGQQRLADRGRRRTSVGRRRGQRHDRLLLGRRSDARGVRLDVRLRHGVRRVHNGVGELRRGDVHVAGHRLHQPDLRELRGPRLHLLVRELRVDLCGRYRLEQRRRFWGRLFRRRLREPVVLLPAARRGRRPVRKPVHDDCLGRQRRLVSELRRSGQQRRARRLSVMRLLHGVLLALASCGTSTVGTPSGAQDEGTGAGPATAGLDAASERAHAECDERVTSRSSTW